MLTDEELQQIRERAERATPGPWVALIDSEYIDEYGPSIDFCYGIEGVSEEGFTGSIEDGKFIANARTDIPRLLDEVERMKKQKMRLLQEQDEIYEEREKALEHANKKYRERLDAQLHNWELRNNEFVTKEKAAFIDREKVLVEALEKISRLNYYPTPIHEHEEIALEALKRVEGMK